MKSRRRKVVVVTAYDAPSSRLADEAGVDAILVGDSAAMTVLGHESTLPITIDEMVLLTRAVSHASRRALVIADARVVIGTARRVCDEWISALMARCCRLTKYRQPLAMDADTAAATSTVVMTTGVARSRRRDRQAD